MGRPSLRRHVWAYLGYLALEAICVGMGMGVPIFCILLGMPVGWYIGGIASRQAWEHRAVLARTLAYAVATSAATFVAMAAIWGRCVVLLFGPADGCAIGMPLLLFTPRESLIAWLVLMILISPFLQFLMTLFGAWVSLMRRGDNARGSP